MAKLLDVAGVDGAGAGIAGDAVRSGATGSADGLFLLRSNMTLCTPVGIVITTIS
ncbi:hypothetical protein [Kineobactrum sediminis]|uniref:hypothetical protein n=1 Tax=Kineobactrum sediminis TaxID=1905677 RepID=UPI0012D78110|nr:hypothetical protein [Kineobactrum sediminis]